MALPQNVQDTLETLPTRPGVYVFKGRDGEILYIGKARSLRSRVRSYFQPGRTDVRFFIERLQTELTEIETFVSATEKEAALLENQLIKSKRPRYNVKLRDDKEYLSLRLDPKRKWPKLDVVRRPKSDGARYFGPYHSATAARQTLRLVNRHFRLRTCSDSEMKTRTRPCLQYQIKRCPGPCVMEVNADEYADQVRDVGLFLSGRHDELVQALEDRMKTAAAEMAYERAALYRDQMRAVGSARQKQRVASASDIDQDAIGLHREAELAEIALLRIRGGRVTNVSTIDIRDISLPDDELIAAFLNHWYERSSVPDEILLPEKIEAISGFAAWIQDLPRTRERRSRPKVLVPSRGPRAHLVQMAKENAAHAFVEKRVARQDVESRLSAVRDRLRMSRMPRRIECLDISHSGGEHAVGALVAMYDGSPDRARYRNYQIKEAKGGDDYGAMYEVLSRRMKRARENQDGWELPDLLVVDGGKGQLGIALGVLQDLEMNDALESGRLLVVGLAKEKNNALGEKLVDRVYLPGQKNPIAVSSTPALQMLAHARDEAHRASNLHRERLASKSRFGSELDHVSGVGPKTRARLLRTLGSLDAVKGASLEQLREAGANAKQAKAIRDHFGEQPAEMESERGIAEGEHDAVERAFEELLQGPRMTD